MISGHVGNKEIMELNILLLFLLFITTRGENLDEKNPQIFSGPRGSYFGFSMDFYQTAERGMNIVVGAPQMKTLHPYGIRGGGGVFLCPCNSETRNCTMIEFNQTVTGDLTSAFGSNGWFGATVRTWKDIIVVCAPFQHQKVINRNSTSDLSPTGACYITSNLRDFHEISLCQVTKRYPKYYFNEDDSSYCEFGFSAEIYKDGTLLVGAPGFNYFQGLYATMNLSIIPTLKPSQSLLEKDLGLWISETLRIYQYDTYQGFSVGLGEFYDNNKAEVVIGSPVYKNMGMVEILQIRPQRKALFAFEGDQIAAYFGHSVAVVDVNNDGKDDVLVGAPLYQERLKGGNLQEVGRVYVYLQKRTNTLSFSDYFLSGSQVYGQFGSSIAPLGDLDLDGFPDVAVGAPFGGKSGGGCVYIYRGKDSGLSSKPSQVIESPLDTPSRFGFSLRGGTDIDGNGYPDLVVGAFEAEKVYVYRSRPVGLLRSFLLRPTILDPHKKLCFKNNIPVSCFTLQVCAVVTGHNLPKKLNLSTEINLDSQNRFSSRTLFLDSSQPKKIVFILLESNSLIACTNFTAYLQDESEFKDKFSPIVVSVNFSLIGDSTADILQPVLYGKTFLQTQSHILMICNGRDTCTPDLHLNASWSTKPLVFGSNDLVHVNFSIFGIGAYEAKLHVTLPSGAHYIRVLNEREEKIVCAPEKENKTEVVVCELGNSWRNYIEINADMQINFIELERFEEKITFPMQIKSQINANFKGPTVWVQLTFIRIASLELRGSLHPAKVFFPLPSWKSNEELKNRKPKDYGENVIHIYELHNVGTQPLKVQLVIQIPESYQGDFILYPLHLEKDSNMVCKKHSKLNPLELDLTVVTEAPMRKDDHRNYKRESVRMDMEDSCEVEEHENHTSMGQRPKHTINLDCDVIPCWNINCSIRNLATGQRATVSLHSILWISSFMKRFEQPFTLLSQASFKAHGFQPTTSLSNYTTTELEVLWVSGTQQKEIPSWGIIVGVLAGLLTQSFFIFALWKLGFFQRIQPPKAISHRQPRRHS